MSETKATPGPWVVVDDAGKGVVTLADVHANDVVIATLPRVNHANAALIALAPMMADLLRAMEAAMSRGEDGYWRIGPMADPSSPDGKGGKVEMLRLILAAIDGKAA